MNNDPTSTPPTTAAAPAASVDTFIQRVAEALIDLAIILDAVPVADRDAQVKALVNGRPDFYLAAGEFLARISPSEKLLREKMAMGLTREQAVSVLRRQREWDLAVADSFEQAVSALMEENPDLTRAEAEKNVKAKINRGEMPARRAAVRQ